MFGSIKTRIICAFTAAAVIAGSLAFPAIVRADDDDDNNAYFMKYLHKLSPDERKFLYKLQDEDDDDDVDEDDVKAAVAEKYYKEKIAEAEQNNKKYQEWQRMQEEWERRNEQKTRVSGIAVSTTYVTLTVGQAYQVTAYVKPDSASDKTVYFNSYTPAIASVDGNGVITANGVGTTVVTATSEDGGYQACITVDVNFPPAVAAQTIAQDAGWTTIAANLITSAAPGQTLDLVTPKAMSFDQGMINALKARPDVALLIGYPYNGHTYLLSVPAGYNLSAHKDKSGKVSFLRLAAVTDGKVATALVK